jgi:hypothetical protein
MPAGKTFSIPAKTSEQKCAQDSLDHYTEKPFPDKAFNIIAIKRWIES